MCFSMCVVTVHCVMLFSEILKFGERYEIVKSPIDAVHHLSVLRLIGALFTFLLTIPLIVTALVVMCVIYESESLVCLTES